MQVSLDVHLEKLISINQEEQSWRATHILHLSWRDPLALESILNSTAAWAAQSAASPSKGTQVTDSARLCLDLALCPPWSVSALGYDPFYHPS